MMEAEKVSEMLDHNSILTKLIAWEYFSAKLKFSLVLK
jgi:hypothetical protein